jgi:hypothetical protein
MPANGNEIAEPKATFEHQHYVSLGEVATIRAPDAKVNEYQNAFESSLVQNSDSSNMWLDKKLPLNPSHIEVRPTTSASLSARALEGKPEKKFNTINCGSFGIRGGRRCQRGDHDSAYPIPNMQDGGYPVPNTYQDDSELARRDTNKKGFESHSCSNPAMKDEWFCKDLSPRAAKIPITHPAVTVADVEDDLYDMDDSPPDLKKGWESRPCSDPTIRDEWVCKDLSPSAAEVPQARPTGRVIVHHGRPDHDISPFLGGHGSYQDLKDALKKSLAEARARARAKKTALIVGITVPVVVCVVLLVFIAWYLRRRAKKIASANGRVAELELETRNEVTARDSQVSRPKSPAATVRPAVD